MKYVFYLILCLPLFFTCKDDKTHIVHREEIDEKEDLSPELRFGALFEQVQMEGVFGQSSTFSNAVPKAFTKEVMKAYEEEKLKEDFDLKQFVEKYFDTNSSVEFKGLGTTDITMYLSSLIDQMKVNSIAAKGSVIEMSKLSLASRQETFPELDYAESYFNMLGLQAKGDNEMVDNFPKNFVYMINNYECIPLKNRSYSLNQTGPPYLSAMINLLESSQGERILKFYLGGFFKEYQYWMKASHELEAGTQINHSVKMEDGAILNRFWSGSLKPRVANYKEDKALLASVGDPEILRQVRAIEESTWLESSRWGMSNNNYEGANITNLIPVDLNALLYNLEKSIARAYKLLKQEPRAEFFFEKAEARKKALIKYCWNEEKGFFFDYNFKDKKQTDVYSLAGLYPLFFEMADSKKAKKVASSLKSKLLKESGLANTNSETGLFWDGPYGKAAYQWIAYKGLKNYKEDDLANEIKSRWIKSQTDIINANKVLAEFSIVDPLIPSDKESSFASSSASVLLKFLNE